MRQKVSKFSLMLSLHLKGPSESGSPKFLFTRILTIALGQLSAAYRCDQVQVANLLMKIFYQ